MVLLLVVLLVVLLVLLLLQLTPSPSFAAVPEPAGQHEARFRRRKPGGHAETVRTHLRGSLSLLCVHHTCMFLM